MKLHRLRLRQFRGVEDRTLEFPDQGVTVVVGDNETGKSSLLEALDLLLALPTDSKASRLLAVQPIGRDVETEVEADLTLGATRLRYRKQWFRRRATELTIRSDPAAGDAMTPTRSFTGREAHNRAAQLFAEHVDQLLWQSLVVAQEDSTTVPVPGSVTALLSALDAAAGASADARTDGGGDGTTAPLVEAVDREYLRYYTPTGRPTGDHADVVARAEQAARAAEEARSQWAQVEADIHDAERLTRDRDMLARKLREQAELVADRDRRRKEAQDLLARARTLLDRQELAAERLFAATNARAARTALVDAVELRAAALADSEEAAARTRAALKEAEDELVAVAEELRIAREEQTARRDDVARLEHHAGRLRDRAELAELIDRCAAVEHALAEESAARVALASNSVDDETLERAEEAYRAVLVAAATLTAGSPKVDVRRLGARPVEVRRVDGPDADRSRDIDDTAELVIDRETVIVVDDVVELRVHPPAEAAGLAAALADAELAERDLLSGLGFVDIAAVRNAARERSTAHSRLAAAEETLTRRLGGATANELRARRDALAARVAEERGEDEPAGDPAEGPQTIEAATTAAAVNRARKAETAARDRLGDVTEREARARKSTDSASEEATATRVRAEQEGERHHDAVAALAGARELESDDRLDAAVVAATAAVDASAAELEAVHAEIVAKGADTADADYAAAVDVRDQLATQVAELRDELGRVEGRLEMAGAHGLASKLEQARTALELAEQERDAMDRRARAANRLRSTLERHRADARRRYAAPLRDRIVALGRTLHGTAAFDVTLGSDLQVVARELDGIAVPMSSLSTGAREQLGILVRLAIAGLTATDGSGVPVVLDDALAWSDPSRLYTMGGLLAKAGAVGQVILLTCAPDRYAYVPGAHVIRI